MAQLDHLFATRLYSVDLSAGLSRLNRELGKACQATAADDGAGQAWCRDNAYPGYTSHGSLNDLPWRYPAFTELVRHLDRHVARFARSLAFDLQGQPLALDSLWINILRPGGEHGWHIHPLSAISGTYYVAVPPGASALKFEDPRAPLMMAAPPRRKTAPDSAQIYVERHPRAMTLLLWESWLRHTVPPNRARRDRISISFNYRWGA